jgi:hypothetical protein
MALQNPAGGVATLVLPGEEDPAQMLQKSSINWGGVVCRKFRQQKIKHVQDENLRLPTLYLHFIDEKFRIGQGELDFSLRAGNDMSEVVIKIDSEFMSDSFASQCGECQSEAKIVIEALKGQGEVFIESVDTSASKVNPGRLFFSLKTARPKAGISLPKKLFGIPETAEQYLFVNNHASVVHFDNEVKEAFSRCIEMLPESPSADIKKFATFLKVFYEGGFGYNKKETMGRGYLPVNVGVAAMSVVPAFEGQLGIGTGWPYALPAKFLPFVDTVEISIDAIRSMSECHGRYGLAFTRTVWVWEGDQWATDKTLDFASILPHGGFFYVPSTLKAHSEKGGFVYSFGESTEDNSGAAAAEG